ncbi:putative D6/D11-like helicase [Tunisvirus fontaine2]|uniref:Putative D6/D11-like helicase n=1 Tax=Tunisvirus fontaine2 TaxID=1421067 RepID=V9SDA6_9VIRU|nr:putative D6/D11-like helicase [Tunisvirus fontaine2]AHC54873.1 putative D6/D11-like helicase [Tunisvirus fontaine2]
MSSNKGMQVPLENFIPLYPSIKDELLQEKLAKKTEFAKLRLEKTEEKEGNFYQHQEILSRIVSPHTEYNEQLVYHGLGSGKCVHPSTLVNVNGSNKEIESVWRIFGLGGPKIDNEGGEWKLPSMKLSVISFDESSKKMCRSTISKLYRQRVREKLNVLELPGGTRLRMTKAHRVLTERGWTNDFSKSSYVAVPKAVRPEKNSRKIPASLMDMIIWFSVYGTFLRNQDPRNFGLGTSPISLSPLSLKDRGKFLFTFRSMREYMNFESFANNFLMENSIGTDRELRPQKTTIRNGDGNDADVICCGFRSGPLERFFSVHEFDYEMRGLSSVFADCSQKDFQKFVELYVAEHSKVDREGSMLLRFYNRTCCLDFSSFLLRFGVRMTVHGSVGKICRRFALRLEEKIDMPLFTVKSIQKRTSKSSEESDPFPLPDFLTRAVQKLGVSSSDLLPAKRNIENMSDARQVLLSLVRARQGDDFCPELENASKTDVRLLSEELSQILEQEILFVPIVSVSEEEFDGYVYDFEVQKNHNYLAEGVITHNTCTAISIASAFSEAKDMEKPLVFASTILQENFRKDLTMCASDSFPKPPGDPTEKAYRIALRRMTDAKFEFWTPTTFYHLILKTFMKDGAIDWELVTKKYSGRLIIIDEVQNLRQDVDEEENVTKPGKDNVYKFMHTFLHRVKNSKIILLSGTPIVNEVWDLAYVMNLILPLDKQLPEEKGFERLLSSAEGREILQDAFRGRVSYLRAAATDTKRFDQGSTVPWINEENFDEWKKATKSKLSKSSRPWTEHIRLFPSAMSKYQQESVRRAETEVIETEGKVSKKGGGFHRFGLDASLFVWPEQDGVPAVELYGTRGFERFATKKGAKGTYGLSPALSKKIRENLGEYSSKFKVIVDRILENPNKLIFVYTSSVKSGGALLFALILKLFGLKQANSGSVTSEDTLRRFAVLQGGMDRNAIQSILGAFTSPENKHGQKIQVLIASRILSQGVTLKNIREVHVLTPHWQSPQIEQAIARSIRLGSHKDLKKSERNVKVFRHVAVNARKGQFLADVTPDILTYKTAETKAVKSAKVLRMMKQNAIDCPLNYARNVDPKDEDGSEACDFDVCDFGCSSARPENPESGPEERYDYPESEYDDSTYDLYYAGKEEQILRDKLVAFFGRNSYANFQSLLSVFGKERLLLSVLSGLIDDRETILDSFGFPCYLAEENDVFYLVKSFGEDQRNFLDIFYVMSPLVTKKRRNRVCL